MTAFPAASTPDNAGATGAAASTPVEAAEPRRGPLEVVWRGRWVVLASLVICLTVSVVYLWRATPVYESRARIMVQPTGPRILPTDPAAAAATQNFLYTQADVIMSYDLLATVPDELRRMGVDVALMPSFQGPGGPVAFLDGSVVAEVEKRNVDIITVRARSPHRRDARDIANAVVGAFVSHHFKEQQSSSQKILELLFAQKARFDGDLREKRQAKLEFLRQNRILATGKQTQNPPLERLAKLTAALTEVELETLQARAAYDATRAVLDDPAKVRQFLESRQFRGAGDGENLRREFRDLRKRLAGMSGQYLPNFPELGAIQASLKALGEEMAAEDERLVEAHVAELEQRVRASQQLEDEIRKQLQAQRQEVLAMNDVAARQEILEAEIASLEKTSDAIDSRIKELSVTENAAPLNIRVVEAAREGVRPVTPNRGRTLFYGLAGGLMVGVALALVRDWTDQRLRSADEIRQALGLPVLGIIPHMSAASAAERGTQVHLDPMSDVAEAYRTVRTAVYFGAGAPQTSPPAGRGRTLLITSPQPGDGKTTLASNLAIAMAQAGNRILLLDADFRRPTQHKIFESAGAGAGLSNVLAGHANLDLAIRATGIPGLDLLPCGPVPANPSEILNSQPFADLLAAVAARYDHVLLDSPPLLPVTDARILAASCGATLLAVRAERSTRKAALHARELLKGVGAGVLGVVVNDAPRGRRGSSYGYSYGEGYGYRYGRGTKSARAATNGNGAAAAVDTPREEPQAQR
jgi:capsular exopolysaccharide synthesis family protein